MRRLLGALFAVAGLLAAASCGNGDEDQLTLRLVTHDSFGLSDGVLAGFTDSTGIDVEVIAGGDAGELVARAVLTAGDPEGDVLFGVDNTFLQRALDGNVFVPYRSPALVDVPDELELDPEHRVTPMDVGDVCVNWWTEALPAAGPPRSLEDLARPEYAASFVTPHPESSSPGFAFLLATIARFGEDGWQDYWRQLAEGGLSVTAGWTEAYEGEFVAGGGERALVTSYAASPVAEVLFADPPVDEPPTGVLTDGCFRQIEFAGVLAGTDHEAEAGQLIDFLLSPAVQGDIPLNMFVRPANGAVAVPPEFARWAVEVPAPLTLDPATIEQNRARWTDQWVDIVLR